MTLMLSPARALRLPARRPLALALSAVMLCGALPPGAGHAAPQAAPAAAPAAAPTAAAAVQTDAATGARRYSMTLKQLGARVPMVLRGIEGSNSVPFDIRADEVVSSAKLTLKYAYSPALLADLSHINVMVNGEVAATVPVPKAAAGANQEVTVDLPPPLITQFNTLNIQLIGHYTMQCEDPLHSSLWANISNRSVLEVTVSPLALANDLALLPLPLYDHRDIRPLSLPVVFTAAPDNATLEAAGTVASWFGALASYRGATFSASVNKLPERGNAVLMHAGALAADGISLPAPTGPTLTLLQNPNDPFGKLLVISGRDTKELKRAAQALVTGSKALTGQTAVISQFTDLAPRRPYDAPRWLRSDRPVKLGELAKPDMLNVSGFSPRTIDVDLRLPPDLFAWRDAGVPLNLKYRYTPQAISSNSTLNLAVNDQFIRTLPLPSIQKLNGGDGLLERLKADSSLPVEVDARIPLQILPTRSKLQFRYQYDYIKQGECRDVIIDNVRGAIEPDSTIDISGYSHYMAMPDLAAYRNTGFPFTRMADLSETAVILPNDAGVDEISALLGILGKLSESSGYPATGVTVARANQVSGLADKDLIVISSGDNQPLLKQWAGQMPVALESGIRRFEFSDVVYRAWEWIVPNPRAALDQARSSMSFSTDGASVVFSGFESPLQKGRSVVAIASSQPANLADAVNALVNQDPEAPSIQGSVSVVRGKEIDSLVADNTYYVGSLTPLQWIQWLVWRYPLLAALLGVLAVAALSVPIYLSLRARSRRRLGSRAD
jgi:hypothetical protein